eukprot:128293-Prymnesium_polylepis.1
MTDDGCGPTRRQTDGPADRRPPDCDRNGLRAASPVPGCAIGLQGRTDFGQEPRAGGAGVSHCGILKTRSNSSILNLTGINVTGDAISSRETLEYS